MNESREGSCTLFTWQEGYDREGESKQIHTVQNTQGKNQERIGVSENHEASADDSRHTDYTNQAKHKNKPGDEVGLVIQSHHFHAFSGLGFFLLGQLGYHVVKWEHKDAHVEEREYKS
jgi:hypothetical protein